MAKREENKDRGQVQDVIQTNDDDKNILKSNQRSLKDLIAPSGVNAMNLNHIEIVSGNTRFARSFFAGILPRVVTFARFLDGLYDFGDNNTSVFIEPIDEGKSITDLNKIITDIESERLMAAKNGNINRQQILADKRVEAEQLRDELAAGLNKLFNVSIQSTIFADSLEQLNKDTELLRLDAAKIQLGIKTAFSMQERAFKSNLPLCDNKIGHYHTFDRRSLSTIFPFTSSNISHKDGILMGINMITAVPVIYDNFDRSLDNYNVVVFAKSGAGKSFTIKILIARSASLLSVQNISLDVDGEYGTLANILGGVNIVFSANSNTIINPFDVEEEAIKDEITQKETIIVNIENKVNDVRQVLLTMARGTTGAENGYVDEIMSQIIADTVKEEYDAIGITHDPSSLYEYKPAQITDKFVSGGKIKKKMPTIGSWYRRIVKKAQENQNPLYQKQLDYLAVVMKQYVRELGGTNAYFDGQTTVDLSDDVPLINFDISKLNERFERPLAQQILLGWIWEKFVKKNSEDKTKARKRRVIIDEAWMLLPFPEAVDFMNTMARRARKRNVSFTVVSQKFQDFYEHKEVQSVLTNADTKIFLLQDSAEIDYLQEVFHLTDGERSFLITCNRGEALMKVGKETAIVKIVTTDTEKQYIETNPNIVAQMNEQRSESLA